LAATYIQWLNARVLIVLPDTFTTAPPGTLEPQPAITTATEKKAQSARSHRLKAIDGARW
jgi:hypothetical protein